MKTESKYITVAYKLYTTDDKGQKELVEEATVEHPFQFISGLGATLDYFESEILKLNKGDKFDFTIPMDEAYGEFEDDHVIDLPKHIFEVDGRFDSKMIAPGNMVPLMDNEGRRLNGTVVEVKDEVVVMDMNHPLAGDDLNFVGEVVENRDATPEEIQGMIAMMSGGGGCGCGCDDGDCGGCGDDQSSECGCGGGHCH